MAFDINNLPSFDQLPVRPGAPPGSAWGLFGDEDEIGTWNLVTPAKTAQAARLVKKGAVFSLNAPLDELVAAAVLVPRRAAPDGCSTAATACGCPTTNISTTSARRRPRSGTGIATFCHPALGFYNGFSHEQVLAQGQHHPRHPESRRARHPTRGVLLTSGDIWSGRVHRSTSTARTPSTSRRWKLAATRSASRFGRAMCCCSASAGWWLRQQSAATAAELAEHLVVPGLLSGQEMAAYLWNLAHRGARDGRDRRRGVAAGDDARPRLPPPQPDHVLRHEPRRDVGHRSRSRGTAPPMACMNSLLTSAPLNIRGESARRRPRWRSSRVWSLVVGGEDAAAREGAARRARTRWP